MALARDKLIGLFDMKLSGVDKRFKHLCTDDHVPVTWCKQRGQSVVTRHSTYTMLGGSAIINAKLSTSKPVIEKLLTSRPVNS